MNTAQVRRTATPVVFVMVLMLTGCTTLGPDYEEPEVEWLSNWQSDLYGQVGHPEQQTEFDVRFWWRVFNDPVLNELIETARRDHHRLRSRTGPRVTGEVAHRRAGFGHLLQ